MTASSSWLTKATVRRDASASALWRLLSPADSTQRANSSHQILWSLFADSTDRTRDFLWREERPGSYLLLSTRLPVDRHNLFELSAPKVFAPVLAVGDRLGFVLRVNATIARGGGPGVRGKPADIVMNALREFPKIERARMRTSLLEPTARAWVSARAGAAGFELEGLAVLSYDTVSIDRGRSAKPAKFGVLDLQGELRVTDGDALVVAITRGFGRAKGFGNGLMLIRRI